MTRARELANIISGGFTAEDIPNLPASKITSGSIADARISQSSVNQHATDYNDNKLQTNVAILGFKNASSDSLAKYNLQDQIIDEYVDASGIDASASVNEQLENGAYYGGSNVTPTIGGNADSTNTYGDYTLHWFTTTGARTFTTDTTQGYEFLIIGGGGSGAAGYGGAGGGAGGLLHNVGGTKVTLTAGVTYTATVGAGGAEVTADSTNGNDGSDSSFAGSGLTTMTALGGGGGIQTGTARAGGSGGGGDYASGYGGAGNQGNSGGLTGYGSNGGRASKSNQTDSGGGGGGAGGMGGYPTLNNAQNHPGQGETGQENSQTMAGHGGIGLQVNIDGNNYYWAGGGGSAAGTTGGNTNGGTGGLGGGGGGGQNHDTVGSGGGSALNAGANGTSSAGGAGGANTGGGGGGTGAASMTGGAGGSGIIVLRRETSTVSKGGDLTLQSTDTTAMSVPTKADMVMLMENKHGTNTLNTDVKGWISRDSGANFTQGTLVDEGTWGTNKKILAFHDLDISGQPSGTSMCYKITTHNQSAGSKEAYIHATSIGWK